MQKFTLCCFVLSVLSQLGCVVTPEEGKALSLPDPKTVTVPSERPLEIRAPRHDDVSNAPRIILGREYACLSTVEIFNPNDEAGYVSKLVISAQPAIAFETVAVEWTGDDSKLPRAAMPDSDGLTRIAYPNVGMQIAPHGSRYARLCGVMKKAVGAGLGKGIEPESGTTVTASLTSVETLGGEHARFTEDIAPARHVLRASLPRITITDLPPSAVRAGGRNLFEWTVEAHWFGPIAIKQFAFHLDFAGVLLCNIRLLDDTDGPSHSSAAVEIAAGGASSRSVGDACLDHPADIAVSFDDEFHFEQDEGVHFSLRADLSDIKDGAAILTGFLRSTNAATDVLRCDGRGYSLLGAGDPTMTPGILWSDLSADPHGSACGKSRDWTTDALVQDFSRKANL